MQEVYPPVLPDPCNLVPHLGFNYHDTILGLHFRCRTHLQCAGAVRWEFALKGSLSRGILLLALLTLTACSDGPTGPGRLDSLRLEPDSPIITVGDTTRIRVTGTTPGGGPATPHIRLRSLDPAVAMVNGAGVVVGVGRGMARIIGEAGGAVDTARVTVIPGRYNVQAADGKQCSDPDYREGHVVAVSEHAIVVADPANPKGGFTTAEYEDLARTFDEVIHPILTDYFGEPADIDGNGRIIIYYTRAVNELTPRGAAGYVGGFFHTRDLFPKKAGGGLSGCSTSNEAEMFYLMVPDPDGTINGNRRGKDLVRNATLGTIAHELQHLINASRRLHVNKAPSFESPWLNEALSHIAEELVFYHAADLSPRENITALRLLSSPRRVDAFNAYQVFNFGRLDWFFKFTESHAAYSDSTKLGDRGAGWHFLRYIADRISADEHDLWFRLVNSTATGLDNLRQAIGQDPLPLYRDWAITAYTDDLVANVAPIYQQPSWNHYSVMPSVSFQPLQPTILQNGSPHHALLKSGGTRYLKFTVAADHGAELQVAPSSAGSPTPAGCAPSDPLLSLQVGEVWTLPNPAASAKICLAASGATRDFVIIVTNAATSGSAVGVYVAGFGFGTTSSPEPNPLLLAGLSPAAAAIRAPAEIAGFDYSVDTRIRQFERAALAELRGSGQSPRQAPAAFQESPGGDANFYVSVVRTR